MAQEEKHVTELGESSGSNKDGLGGIFDSATLRASLLADMVELKSLLESQVIEQTQAANVESSAQITELRSIIVKLKSKVNELESEFSEPRGTEETQRTQIFNSANQRAFFRLEIISVKSQIALLDSEVPEDTQVSDFGSPTKRTEVKSIVSLLRFKFAQLASLVAEEYGTYETGVQGIELLAQVAQLTSRVDILQSREEEMETMYIDQFNDLRGQIENIRKEISDLKLQSTFPEGASDRVKEEAGFKSRSDDSTPQSSHAHHRGKVLYSPAKSPEGLSSVEESTDLYNQWVQHLAKSKGEESHSSVKSLSKSGSEESLPHKWPLKRKRGTVGTSAAEIEILLNQIQIPALHQDLLDERTHQDLEDERMERDLDAERTNFFRTEMETEPERFLGLRASRPRQDIEEVPRQGENPNSSSQIPKLDSVLGESSKARSEQRTEIEEDPTQDESPGSSYRSPAQVLGGPGEPQAVTTVSPPRGRGLTVGSVPLFGDWDSGRASSGFRFTPLFEHLTAHRQGLPA